MIKKGLFWSNIQADLAGIDPVVKLIPSTKSYSVDFMIYKLSYTSLYNERIHGLLITPKIGDKFPLVIDYLGYMNFINGPEPFYHWAEIGCACLVIDNRQQGGETLDQHQYGSTIGSMPMGNGFLSPDDFYMKRVVADHLLELTIGCSLSIIDKTQVFLRGASQGGGLAVMIGSLTRVNLQAVFADVPSQSNLEERIDTRAGSYGILSEYLELHPEKRQQMMDTMAYFDTQYFAEKLEAPIYCSVGDQDITCPPADFMVTYNRIKAPKELKVYHGHAHEGGGAARVQWETEKVRSLLKNNIN